MIEKIKIILAVIYHGYIVIHEEPGKIILCKRRKQ